MACLLHRLALAPRILLGYLYAVFDSLLEGASIWPRGAAVATCRLRSAMTAAKATIGSCCIFLTSVLPVPTTAPYSILIFSSVFCPKGPAYTIRNFYTIISRVTAAAVNTCRCALCPICGWVSDSWKAFCGPRAGEGTPKARYVSKASFR